MRIIGLTGSIACGKSNISDKLYELGAAVIDGDKLSRELTAPGGEALPALREVFGETVFREDGTLDRKALGRIVFADPERLRALDDLMQPLLRSLILRRIEACRMSGTAVCVLDMPLLYEKQLDALCDTVWCAWLPADEQLSRLMLRDGFTENEARQRIAGQLSADEKAGRADIVIDTSGSIEETRQKVVPLWEAELANA